MAPHPSTQSIGVRGTDRQSGRVIENIFGAEEKSKTVKNMKTCFLRQLTATYQQWYEKNPVLPLGVIGYVSDNNTFKFGNGVTPWNSLPLFTGEASGGITIVGAPAAGSIPAFDAQGNLVDAQFYPEDFNATLDTTSLDNLTGCMTSSSWDASGIHWLIPVIPGTRYRLNAASNKTIQYGWLTSEATTGAVPFVSGTTLVETGQNETVLVQAPAGAKYLCINISKTTGGVTTTYEPEEVVRIGGIFFEDMERLHRDLGYSANETKVTLTQGTSGKYVKCSTRQATANENFAISQPFDVEACSELLIKTGFNPSDNTHKTLDISIISIYEQIERTRAVQAKDGSNNPLYYEVDEDGNPTSTTTTEVTDFPVYTTETFTEERYLPNNEDRFVNIPDSGYYIANIPQSCKVVVSYKPGVTDMDIIVVKHGALANLTSQIFGIYERRTMIEAVVLLATELEALKSRLTQPGNIKVGTLDVVEVLRYKYPDILIATGAPANNLRPENCPADLPWDGIPIYIGQVYIDKTNKKIYIAVGISAIADWICLNPS